MSIHVYTEYNNNNNSNNNSSNNNNFLTETDIIKLLNYGTSSEKFGTKKKAKRKSLPTRQKVHPGTKKRIRAFFCFFSRVLIK
jgi:hypothetical protein